ncbi:hypothetical protein EBQ90_02780 [bacterium]|nr:hypothetical protein [bacterium]
MVSQYTIPQGRCQFVTARHSAIGAFDFSSALFKKTRSPSLISSSLDLGKLGPGVAQPTVGFFFLFQMQ